MGRKKKKSSAKKNVTPTKKPVGTVKNLRKPSLSGNTFSTQWSLTAAAKNKKAKNHWTSQYAEWTFDQVIPGGSSSSGTTSKKKAATKSVAKKKNAKKPSKKSGTKKAAKAKLKTFTGTLKATKKTFSTAASKAALSTGVKIGSSSTATSQNSALKALYNSVLNLTKTAATQTGQHYVRWANLSIKTTALSQKVDFAKYHPTVQGHYLTSVSLTIRGKNRKGLGKVRKSAAFVFSVPTTPAIDEVSFNTDDDGKLKAKITAVSEGAKHRFDTCWWITRQDNIDPAYQNATIVAGKSTFKADDYTPSYDVGDYGAVDYDHWMEFTFRAISRGCRGNSSEATPRRYIVAYPAVCNVKTIDVIRDQPKEWDPVNETWVDRGADEHNGLVIVNVGFSSKDKHPVDTTELWRLKSVARTPEQAAFASGWEKVTEDNGTVSAMKDTISAAYPPVGVRVWYRLVTKHGPFERIGTAFEAAELYHGPSKVSFIDARAVDDGEKPTAIELYYGFKTDEADGTQLEWSTLKNAVRSNTPPDTYDDLYVLGTEDAKAIMARYNVTGFNYVSQFFLTGLTEGEKYYLSGLRFAEGDNGRVLGDRTYWRDPGTKAIAPILFGLKPRNVELTVPRAVNPGKDYRVSWSFDSSFEQTAYTLFYVDGDGVNVLRERAVTNEMATTLSQDDILRAAYIDTESGHIGVTLRVLVETSGLKAMSSNATTVISEPPDCQIALPSNISTLTAQPLSFSYKVTQASNLLISVYAEGTSGEYVPGVDYIQAPGDVVWTGVLSVAANADEGDSPVIFKLPQTCEFHDNARYTLSVIAQNPTTGLQSEERTIEFEVNWARKAQAPSTASTISVDPDLRYAYISPRSPENYDSEHPDVCDVYRVTPDGAYLIQSSVKFGATIVDKYVPYSKTADLCYYLCTRTMDGDYEYLPFSYGLPGYMIRFDWGTGDRQRYLEVPYNLRIGDSYAKDFERRVHLDGTVTGHWNEGVQRDGSLQTDLIKLSEPRQKELVRELARYPGAVFVRTPDGCAYLADVQVSNFQTDYDSLVVPVTFDAKEIDLTPAYMAELLEGGSAG